MTAVVIAAFRAMPDAASARAALEQEGIAAEVRERSDDLPRMCVDAFDEGFDVVVDESDAHRGIAALQRLWPDDAPRAVEERCPACGAAPVVRLPRLRIFLVAAAGLFVAGVATGQRELFALVIGIAGVLLLLAPGRRCRACGERWRGGGPPPVTEREAPEVPCPRCGSDDTGTIPRRREKALTLLVAYTLPPTILFWPFLPRRRCGACGNEWR